MSQMNYAFADVLCNYAINFFSTKIIKNLMLINRNFHKKLKKYLYKKKNILNNNRTLYVNISVDIIELFEYIKRIHSKLKHPQFLSFDILTRLLTVYPYEEHGRQNSIFLLMIPLEYIDLNWLNSKYLTLMDV